MENHATGEHISFWRTLVKKVGNMSIKSGLVLMSVVFALAFTELALRLIPKPPKVATAENDPQIGAIYKKNLDVQIEAEDNKGKVRFKTNGYGFVGNDWRSQKTGIRLANHGDSFTAGGSVAFEENFTTKLGKKLEQYLNNEVESINFGVSGQGTDDSYRTYLHYSSKTSPDIVILWMYLGNDLNDNYQLIQKSLSSGNNSSISKDGATDKHWFRNFIRKTELFQSLTKAAIKSPRLRSFVLNLPKIKNIFYSIALAELPADLDVSYTEGEKNKLATEITRQELQKFSRRVLADGRKFFVFLIPAHFQVDKRALQKLLNQHPKLRQLPFDPQKPNQVLTAILDELSVPYFDLTPSFSEACRDECPLYYCSFCHLSDKGHTLAADKAAEIIYKKFFENQSP